MPDDLRDGAAISADDEQLIAFLDGKLDATAAGRIESRLAADDTLRARADRLQRAWSMLDVLPRSDVSESFTETTIEMVAIAAEGELRSVATRRRRRQWLVGAAGAGTLAAAAVFGFWITRQAVPDPNRQLLEDLPIIEELDLYQQVGTIEFLEQLADSDMFAEEAENDL